MPVPEMVARAVAAPETAAVAAGAALVGGVALGMLRERSLSLWPGVALVWAGALVALGLRSFWG